MSLFETQEIPCPSCGKPVGMDVFHSVNADRRPDLREEVIERTLQQRTCPNCDTTFRLDPEFNYLDAERGQWLSAHPFADLGNWAEVETADQAAFDKSYGPKASAGAQELGAGLKVRITFGWAAFREKLIAAAHGLDDRELELLKIALLRTQDNAPLSDEIELRLVDVIEEGLVMVWLNAVTDSVVETLIVPQRAYDEIDADRSGWQDLRAALSAGPFVDMQRLMI